MSRIRASAACDATGLTLRGLQASQLTENQDETSERIALRAAHRANEERTAPGTDPGTASTRLIHSIRDGEPS